MNRRSTFDVLFYVKRQAPLRDGSLPVMCKITVNGTKSCFSCKLSASPEIWANGKAVGRSDEAKKINRDLARIEESVRVHYRLLGERDFQVTAEKVKNAHLGLSMRQETLLKVYEQFLSDFKKLVAAGLKEPSTLLKYTIVYRHLKEFIEKRYRQRDIGLKEIVPAFITDFEVFLKTDRRCSHNTVALYMIPLRKMIRIARKNRLLNDDPFCDYGIKREETEREHLDSKEIQSLMAIKLKPKKEFVRDLFVFCIFSGLSFIDLYTLSKDDIRRDADGRLWIVKERGKTKVESVVRLMDIPRRILEKYEGLAENGLVFPVPKYKMGMYYIKIIARQCGIQKPIGWHLSRHTMATEVCLTHGMPIETLSKILGHKSIKTTQIYAKVTEKKSNYDMDRLESRLNQAEDFQGLAVGQ
jgi:site-specific recombinase XerD